MVAMSILSTIRFAFEALFRLRGDMPQPGAVAPAFATTDHLGRTVSLSQFRGKRAVLWFYPKADTPG